MIAHWISIKEHSSKKNECEKWTLIPFRRLWNYATLCYLGAHFGSMSVWWAKQWRLKSSTDEIKSISKPKVWCSNASADGQVTIAAQCMVVRLGAGSWVHTMGLHALITCTQEIIWIKAAAERMNVMIDNLFSLICSAWLRLLHS